MDLHRIFRVLCVPALFLALSFRAEPVLAQEGDGDLPSLLGFDGLAPSIRADTSARLAAWDPQAGSGLIAVHFSFPEGYHQIDDEQYFLIQPHSTPGIVFGSTLKAEPEYRDGLAEYYDETTLVIEFYASDRALPGDITLDALFQICDEAGVCLFPDSETHRIAFDPSGPAINADPSVTSIVEWNAARSEFPPRGDAMGKMSYLLFFLMALAGGFLLNLMPCVLPLLSVKALGLVKQAGSERRLILRRAWVYVAGIEVSFWALAALVILIQASGRRLGWGFQFQSPPFVLLLTAVIWVFALSLFDVFVIEAPQRGVKGAGGAASRGGYLGNFLTGVFAVLVATPCTAPFLGSALGFAFSQPPWAIGVIFSLTGLGFGLPFLLLGRWPGLIQKLPSSGPWMVTFKQAMGFLLVGTAVYLFTTFSHLAPGIWRDALWWMAVLGFSSWLLGLFRRPAVGKILRLAGSIAALLIAVGSGVLLIDFSDPAAAVEELNFDEEDVRRRIALDQPIFLEFTAAWCTTCKVNQRVIHHKKVQELMKERAVTHIIGDLTAYDETLIRWLGDFGRAGVPLYVLYRPGREPHVFPEFITVDGLIRELKAMDA